MPPNLLGGGTAGASGGTLGQPICLRVPEVPWIGFLGWVRQFCVRSGFGDRVMGDTHSDIMFVHSGIFPFSTSVFLNYSRSCLPSCRHTKYVCKIFKTHPCPLQQPQIPIQHPHSAPHYPGEPDHPETRSNCTCSILCRVFK